MKPRDVVFWLVVSVVAFHAFAWSFRAVDLSWCQEGLVAPAANGATDCDEPSRVQWSQAGQHWICKCP